MTCTLDGDMVDPHGVVQGGYRQKRENVLNLYQNFVSGGKSGQNSADAARLDQTAAVIQNSQQIMQNLQPNIVQM